MGSVEMRDVIIVGAGSSGCALASGLSHVQGLDVLLLEAGLTDRNPWLRLPIGYYRTMFDDRYSWRFLGEPEAALNQRIIEHPQGKVLGGSSSINGLVYIRGAASDYDGWAKLLSDPRWRYDKILPLFIRSERNHDLHDDFHGDNGGLEVAFPHYDNPFLDAFVNDAVRLGIPANPDFNGLTLEGVGRFQLTAARGMRSSSARAFLPRASKGLEVRVGQRVTRVLLEKHRAIGVDVMDESSHASRLLCRHEVVLCAGAINTPKLLQLSGIGPADLLHRLGLQVAVNLPDVGANLQDHLQVRMAHETEERNSLNALQNSLLRRARAAARYLWQLEGDLTVGAGVVGLFAYSELSLPAPDIQMHVIPFSAAVPGRLHAVGGVTTSVCGLRPFSRGTVEAAGVDPFLPPRICFNYLSDIRDLYALREGLRLASRILAGPAVSRLVRSQLFPEALDMNDDAAIDAYVRSSATTIFHPAGTCAMGRDGSGGVDSRLRVHGITGLRVADASIMPAIVSGNTNAACIMIGERAADEIAASLLATPGDAP